MDLIIRNGTIVTDSEMFRANLAVKDGKIAAIGNNLSTEGCPCIVDAADKLVLPGLIDSHIHITMGAMMDDNDIDLEGTKSAEECAAIVRDYLERNPDTDLILASGWMVSM